MPTSIEIPNNEQLSLKLETLEIKLDTFKSDMERLKTNLTNKTDRHDIHIATLMAKIERIEDEGRLTPTSSYASDITVGSPMSGGAQRKKKKSKKGKKRRTNRR